VGEIEFGAVVCCGPSGGGGTRATLEVATHLYSFIFFDGAGVGLFLGDADRFERVQNGVALDFEFTCKIVNSNFAHSILVVVKVSGAAA
jgi:hypothetical protein